MFRAFLEFTVSIRHVHILPALQLSELWTYHGNIYPQLLELVRNELKKAVLSQSSIIFYAIIASLVSFGSVPNLALTFVWNLAFIRNDSLM